MVTRLLALCVQISRKLLTLLGALMMSGSQFVLTFVLMRRMAQHDFGQIAFLLIVYQFLLGCWGALLCAPLLVTDDPHGVPGSRIAALTGANMVAACAMGLILPLVVRALGGSWPAAGFFAIYCALMLARQYGRTLGLYHQARHRVMASDLVFALAVLVMAARYGMMPEVTMVTACAGLAGAAALSLLVLLLLPGGRHMLAVRRPLLSAYRPVWRKDARWSLAGVLTTELSVNAHAYLVTMLFGPGAFAPIAAAGLFVRPILVVINPLAEFERVHMARAMVEGELCEVLHRRDLMRMTALAVWSLCAGGMVAGLALLPAAQWAGHMPAGALGLATGLWFAVALVRCFYVPDGAVLQAAGQFRPLAALAGASGAVSALMALLACLILTPTWSLGGILMGEAVYGLLLSLRLRHFFREGAGDPLPIRLG